MNSCTKSRQIGIDSVLGRLYRLRMARILFDEAHSEAWTIRPELAAEINPSHPADSSYAKAAEILRAHDFEVEAHVEGTWALQGAAVLVIAHPSESRWERVVPNGVPVFSTDELDAIEAFVRGGGGLVLLAEEEQDKYGSNLAELAARFGITVDNAVIYDYERHHHAPSWVLADLVRASDGVDLLARVDQVCFYRAGSLTAGGRARGARPPPPPPPPPRRPPPGPPPPRRGPP